MTFVDAIAPFAFPEGTEPDWLAGLGRKPIIGEVACQLNTQGHALTCPI